MSAPLSGGPMGSSGFTDTVRLLSLNPFSPYN